MEILKPYFPYLTEKQYEQYTALPEIYQDLNQKINVISRKDMEYFEERHVLHSLSIAKILSFKKGAVILDVGTGGGFPGIPLAIMFPETQFHLVDSIGKKIKVVESVCQELSLENVLPIHQRAEDISGKYDFILSRAVTNFPDFYAWVRHKIKKENKHALANGFLCLKGGEVELEFADFEKKTTIFDIADFFPLPFFETKKVVYVKS